MFWMWIQTWLIQNWFIYFWFYYNGFINNFGNIFYFLFWLNVNWLGNVLNFLFWWWFWFRFVNIYLIKIFISASIPWFHCYRPLILNRFSCIPILKFLVWHILKCRFSIINFKIWNCFKSINVFFNNSKFGFQLVITSVMINKLRRILRPLYLKSLLIFDRR